MRCQTDGSAIPDCTSSCAEPERGGGGVYDNINDSSAVFSNSALFVLPLQNQVWQLVLDQTVIPDQYHMMCKVSGIVHLGSSINQPSLQSAPRMRTAGCCLRAAIYLGVLAQVAILISGGDCRGQPAMQVSESLLCGAGRTIPAAVMATIVPLRHANLACARVGILKVRLTRSINFTAGRSSLTRR
jgi:hypothetical protein